MISSPNILYPQPLGAIERFTLGLSKELSKKIAVSISGFGVGMEASNNFRLTTYSSNAFNAFRHFPQERARGLIQGTIYDIHVFKDIQRVHKEKPIDIIHAHTIYAAPIAVTYKMILGIPFVNSVHNEVLTSKPFFTCDRVLPVSNCLKTFLATERGLTSRMTVLNDAIDPQFYKPSLSTEAAKVALGLSDYNVLLFVGRKCPQKGPEVLINAMPEILKHYPKTKAIFLGPDYYFGSSSSNYTAGLLTRAKELNVRSSLIFKQYVTDEELKLHYTAADIFICPSVWAEPFGLVLLEAMSYGKPVVASKVGAIPEIVLDKTTGLLFSPGNFNELASNVVYLFKYPTIRSELGATGRTIVETQFSFEVISERCLEIYKEVLDNTLFRK